MSAIPGESGEKGEDARVAGPLGTAGLGWALLGLCSSTRPASTKDWRAPPEVYLLRAGEGVTRAPAASSEWTPGLKSRNAGWFLRPANGMSRRDGFGPYTARFLRGGDPPPGHSPALRKLKERKPVLLEGAGWCCRARGSPSLAAAGAACQGIPDLSFLNYKIIALPRWFSGRDMISVKPRAPCCMVCEFPGQSYSEQGDTFRLLGLHPWDCPTAGIREKEKKSFREVRTAELGCVCVGGGGIALVPPSTPALRPPPQHHLALAWELHSVSVGVVRGLGPERFWAA